MKRKKSFRATPNAVQDSMKIIVGNKTNSRVKDFEDDDKNIEEKTGIIVSIDKNKINGNGWTVQCEDGTYQCNCSSNLYNIPESKEKNGILYPKKKIQCKIKINPVLKISSITEIGGSKKQEEKLDISKWTHKDYDTQVIASVKSAISVSDGAITFNYDDKNGISIDEKGTKIDGTTNVDSLLIQDELLDSYIYNQILEYQKQKNKTDIITDGNDTIKMNNNDENAEMNLNYENFTSSSQERVIGNILDQKQTPLNTQTRPLLSNDGDEIDINELKIYDDGLITIKGTHGIKSIQHTEKWITQNEKNILKVIVSGYCDFCEYQGKSNVIYIDYCPVCHNWNVLFKSGNQIICSICRAKFCHACGHNENEEDKENLKYYENNHFIATTSSCKYCTEKLPNDTTKQYVNFCPECKQWQTLNIINEETEFDIVDRIICNNCNTKFCTTCGTQQSGYITKNFDDNEILYEDYIKKMKKLKFIQENLNG